MSKIEFVIFSQSYASQLTAMLILCICICAQSVSCVRFFVTPWTIAHQAPLFFEIFQTRILEWVVISLQGIKPRSPALQASSLPLSHLESPILCGLRPKYWCLASFTFVFYLAVKPFSFSFKVYIELNHYNHLYNCTLGVTVFSKQTRIFLTGLLACIPVLYHFIAKRTAREILTLIKGKSDFVSHLSESVKCFSISMLKPRSLNWFKGLTYAPSCLSVIYRLLLLSSSLSFTSAILMFFLFNMAGIQQPQGLCRDPSQSLGKLPLHKNMLSQLIWALLRYHILSETLPDHPI